MNNAEKDKQAPQQGVSRDPVSRPELEKLEAQRLTPAPGRDLTPDGAQNIKALDAARRENRIKHIEVTLGREKDRAVTDFALGQMKGRARRDFDRSR